MRALQLPGVAPSVAPARPPVPAMPDADSCGTILRLLTDGRRFDFGPLPAQAVRRRIERRMRRQLISSIPDYVALLRRSPDEVHSLRAELLASGTTFFRDRQAWDFIERHVVPRIIAHPRPSRPVRVWVPYCGAGADAYALAMLLLEQVRAAGCAVALQVFASDVDERSLEIARAGRFPSIAATAIGSDRLDRFFVASGDGYRVKPELRRSIVFARHDLFSDVPFSHIDLVCCRYLFMHLQPWARVSVAELLRRALNDGGHLVLGMRVTRRGCRR